MLWAVLILVGVILYFLIKMVRSSIKHSAVQNAFLAKVTFDKLNDQEQDKVEQKAIEILKRGGPNSKEHGEWIEKTYDNMGEFQKFSILALSMAEFNIQPGLPNETWHYVKKPIQSIEGAEHQINICQNHFFKKHNIRIHFN